jgi:hypothetical protein
MTRAPGEPETGAVPEPGAPVPGRPAIPATAPERFGLLLLLLIATYLLSAFTTGTVINAVQIVVFVGALLLALRNSRMPRWISRLVIGVVSIGSAAAFAIALSRPYEAAVGVAEVWTGLVLLTAVVVILRRILETPTVTLQSIYGAISAYMVIGLMFAAFYGAMNRLGGEPFFANAQPGNTRTFQYFSFTTLTTLGYGDFTSASNAGRAVAVVEAMIGQIFLATLVARLVSAFQRPERRKQVDREAGRMDRLLSVRRASAHLAQPGDDVLPHGGQAAGGIERRAVRVVRLPVQIRAADEQILSGAALAARACMPEGLRHILRRRIDSQDRFEAAEHSQGGRLPGLVDTGAARHQEPGDMPAAVADGVVERSANRTTGRLDVRSAVDQDLGHVHIVAARRIMQRRFTGFLVTVATGRAGVRVRPGLDQQARDHRPVEEVAGPVGDNMQRRRGAAVVRHQPGRCQRGIIAQQPLDCFHVTRVNGPTQPDRDFAVTGYLAARLALAHVAHPATHGTLRGRSRSTITLAIAASAVTTDVSPVSAALATQNRNISPVRGASPGGAKLAEDDLLRLTSFSQRKAFTRS